MTYIATEIAEKIKDTAKVLDVISDHVQLKKKGSAHVGTCPICNAKKGFEVSESKSIWKCFKCDEGGNSATSFLMKAIGKTYPEALKILADRYNILIEQSTPAKKRKKATSRKRSFRDQQLRDSGISIKYQKYWLTIGDAQHERDRYQSGTVDSHFNILKDGDDMILNYLDLDGKPIAWKKAGSDTKRLIRIRWANPGLHKNKDGKPAKYKSPYKSGSHLWIPNHIISAYKTSKIIETLYICEGEKKADKLCIEGLDAVGIMGIHNFATAGEMPYHFEQLIKTCAIQNVVFVLDADWQEISTSNPERSVESRPNLFFKAVTKFKDYFRHYYTSGIELELFFMYHHDMNFKGIDDLLTLELKGKSEELREDISKTMISRDGKGMHVDIIKITEMSSYKLAEFWNLHAPTKFFEKHKEELIKLREFKFRNIKWKWNKEEEEFELTQKIMPHEKYWKQIPNGEKANGEPRYKYNFNYANSLNFLRSHGFGIYEYGEEQMRFVHLTGKIMKEISTTKIQRYVMDFSRQIQEPDVLELLLRGGKQYLGPDKLSNMFYITPEFNEAQKDCQFLYFQNCYWKITADEIIQRPISELPKHVWDNKIIKFEPKYLGKPMVKAKSKGDKWGIHLEDEVAKSDIANFYINTSTFNWRNRYELTKDKDGIPKWTPKAKASPETDEEAQLTTRNLICKMIAAGFVLHEYRDYGNMKAIICQDGVESEVGKSQGGTGKSLWSKSFEFLVPQEVIDGKKRNIQEDNHLYENVDERTQVIVFDDVRVNFPFEFLFSQITTGLVVNPKGEKRYKVLPPKFIINTNHSLNGDGNSFDRRQYNIAFSDYYNKQRRVSDEFGHQFFYEWEYEQWNLFYNWKATCIQLYLQHGLKTAVPSEALEKRKLRQKIGENFMDWADVMFDERTGPFMNNRFEKIYATEKYLIQYSKDRRFVTTRIFKDMLQNYAKYKGYDYNLPYKGGRIKQNGKEYFLLSNDKYSAGSAKTISNDNEIQYRTIPNNDNDEY